MAAKARTLFLSLAAFCLPVLANVPIAEKPHLGVAEFALASHRGVAVAKPLMAPGMAGCLCDFGGRSRSTGKERDGETGLDYFGARYMSAAQGRFTSPDPLFFQKEMLVDSQRWNLYTYVRNNPLRFIDPTGERIELTGETEDERRRQLAAIQGTVGKEAGSRLTIQEDKKTGQFFVGITGDVSTFREINSAASTFATIIGLNEVAKFDIVGSAQRLNISWTGADGSPQNTLMQARAEGAAGRDATGQLWVYVKQPREGYADVEASKMGSRFFGGFRDQSTVVGHEFGHALGFMMQRLAGETTNSAATNQESLSLENKVRQVQRPGSPPRLRH